MGENVFREWKEIRGDNRERVGTVGNWIGKVLGAWRRMRKGGARRCPRQAAEARIEGGQEIGAEHTTRAALA
jgi:hypothetical protein